MVVGGGCLQKLHKKKVLCFINLLFTICNQIHSITELYLHLNNNNNNNSRMMFMKFEGLRAKNRVNYDKLVIKHHLDKTIKSIEEYNDNV